MRRLGAMGLALALLLWAVGALAAPGVLEIGSRGEAVRSVQARLAQWGYYDGAVDGLFGEATARAVRLFQKRNGLAQDGRVGEQTASAMGISLKGGTIPQSSAARGDLELLARVVHGEARGESYTGKVAVAAVVLNRVDSPAFPDTVAGVVYQRNAFTAVQDGQINLTPDEEAYRAAQDALNGWDPSGGALYYYNPAIATSSWIYSRKVVTTIGRHRFAV